MGRRPDDPEGSRAELEAEQLIDLGQPYAQFALERGQSRRVRRVARILPASDRLEARRGGIGDTPRPRVEAALDRSRGPRKAKGKAGFTVALADRLPCNLLDA